MRIVVVTEAFYPQTDESTKTLKAVVDQLIDLGHRLRIVAPAPGLSRYRGAEVVRVSALASTGGQVRAAIDGFRPDAALLPSPRRLGRRALSHAEQRGIGTLVVEHAGLDRLPPQWGSQVAARADRLLVTSRWMRTELGRHGIEAGLWQPGVDTRAYTPALRDQWLHERWSKARSTGGLVVVGFLGGLHRRHGVRRLADLNEVPGIRLVLVGHGPQREWLERKLPGAKFTGAISTGEQTIALPTFDALVHPGEQLTCAHALREASAAGVPVIAPRRGGAVDVVRHLESGVLYEPDRPGDLARAVGSVAADPRRALLGERGRELSVRDWAAAARELVTHLAGLAPATAQKPMSK